MARTKLQAPQISTGITAAANAATVSSSSATYISPASNNIAVTVVVPASGQVQVCISGLVFMTTNNVGDGYMSFVLSGANTVASTDARSISNRNTAGIGMGACFLLTGLTPGSTTFTTQIRCSADTVNILNRNISVEPK